ncbi:MAG: methyl-viologen-reducing hydrogenase subunit delta [Caldithrix sp. RBG_13_44_9]|nr:MAG: methyl-viologen-reducing hydrogenase subunit delta [Caldithrix sp. RBG_13_44_9]
MPKKTNKPDFEPRIVVFACNWCSYPAADSAGINRMQYPPNVRIIRTMCMGRVNPSHVLKALELGADGVLVSGCHFADCHYSFGARKAAEQYKRLEAVVRILGFEKERIRQEFISAAEFPKFVKVVKQMVDQVKKLGPSPVKKQIEKIGTFSKTETALEA